LNKEDIGFTYAKNIVIFVSYFWRTHFYEM
jgi:hypothetical protein